MGFIGLIRLIALALAVWLVWRFVSRRNVKSADSTHNTLDQKVVQCVVCGTHVPESEALSRDGDSFCCQEHLEAWEKENDRDQ